MLREIIVASEDLISELIGTGDHALDHRRVGGLDRAVQVHVALEGQRDRDVLIDSDREAVLAARLVGAADQTRVALAAVFSNFLDRDQDSLIVLGSDLEADFAAVKALGIDAVDS